MKVRTGFVSNSSSSSFVLTVSKGTSEEEIRAMVESHVGSMEGFFILDFRQNLIDTIMECKGEKINLKKELKFEQDWINKNPDSSTDGRDQWQKIIDKNIDYYQGGFSDNGEGSLQAWLCDTSFKIEENGFFMENTGGY